MLKYNAKPKQERFHEELLNMEQCIKDTHTDINKQSMHTNEDSAKKRAVMQHMDYEGFR